MRATPHVVLGLLGTGFVFGWIVGRGFMRSALQRASKLQSGKR